MASRYGRKKRRKHLELIRELSTGLKISAAEGLRVRRAKEQAEDMLEAYVGRVRTWDDHLRQLLGRDTAFTFEPGVRKEDYFGEIRQAHILPELSYPIGPEDFAKELEAQTAQVENVLRFVGGLSAPDLMSYKRFIHMTLLWGEDRWGAAHNGAKSRFDWNYAISQATLDRGLTEHQMIHMAEQIALQFHKRMKEELGVKEKEMLS